LRLRVKTQKDLPEDWHRIEYRVSKVAKPSEHTQRNRNATHPVNATLNYAYGILESLVRMQIVASGLDPAIGYLHGHRFGKHVSCTI
jgi:CRISPR/Cas system-associated endonuclease Cas1